VQSWASRWHKARNELLSNTRFQRWAASFPLTRPLARRHAHAVFDLCAGFVYSQILFACVRLKLFETLAQAPRSVGELSKELGLSPEAVVRLMAAAISLRLVERCGPTHFGLGIYGAAVMANPSIAAMVEHHAILYADLQDPVALLRNGGKTSNLAGFWPYAGASTTNVLTPERTQPYTALMSHSQALIADDILDAYDFGKHTRLLDVGGGNGTFIAAAAARHPSLGLQLFDLPAVAANAQSIFEANGLGARAQVFGGNFLVDPLPAGADLVTLVRIVHDHDDDTVLALLRAVRRAIRDDGVLLIAEPMSDTPGAERIADAYFGFYLLAMGSGRPRSSAAISKLLEQAGFARHRTVPTRRPFLTRLIVATPTG
jgi:demethylspheroidene O-methyltransferase